MHTNKEAIQRLSDYCREMRDWELACAKRESLCDEGQMEYAESERIGMEEYAALFANYCASTAEPRDYVFTEPPQHDPDNHTIEEVLEDDGRIKIQLSLEAGPTFRFLYELVLENGQWKIQSKHHLGHDGKLIVTEL